MEPGYSQSRIGDFLRGFRKKRPPDVQTDSVDADLSTVTEEMRRDVSEAVPATGIEGVVTDQKVLQWYFRRFEGIDTSPVATDRFMEKSKEVYNAAWLSREIAQNFVDHNRVSPGTLDGVTITKEKVNGNGLVRYTIRGAWPFEDPTGLISPHSEKPKEFNTAGGNGIGLKQVAIRYLRDFGVKRFEVQGRGWTVNYRLAKAERVNEVIANNDFSQRVRHDWLLADLHEAEERDTCTYILETENPEVIASLDELVNIAVSERNPYLQNPDFKNKHGAIKWLKPSEDEPEPQGRLFINGQVMNYREKGKNAEDYWYGPDIVTLQLNDIDYSMSIDRPPLTAYDLKKHIETLIASMSKEDLIDQLRRSEHIWSAVSDSGFGKDRKGCFVVIEHIVDKLWFTPEYENSEFPGFFGGKPYLCLDFGVNEQQIHDLQKLGYVIYPYFFYKIGMPKASSKLDSIEVASNEKPQPAQYRRQEIAEKYGFTVAHEQIGSGEDQAQLLRSFRKRLAPHIIRIEKRREISRAFRVYLNVNLPKELLFHEVSSPKTDEQKVLHFLRGIIFAGLSRRIFEKVFTSSGDYISTFSIDYDGVMEEQILFARNVKCTSDQGVFIEFELAEDTAEEFESPISVRETETSQAQKVPVEGPAIAVPREEKKPEEREADRKDSDGKGVAGAVPPKDDPLKDIPVSQPAVPAGVIKEREVSSVEGVLSTEEERRIQEMRERIPEVKEAVLRLQAIVPKHQAREGGPESPVKKYVGWRNSRHFYGQAGEHARYLTGRHLLEILSEHDQAAIPVRVVERTHSETEMEMARLNFVLKTLANRFATPENEVDEFEIVLDPASFQLAQIGMLREYLHLTTKVALPNDVFIYRGTGSKGVNIAQKAIGLHESLFEVDFLEALRTFVHETAHNASMEHGPDFMHTMESLFSEMNARLTGIAEKLKEGVGLSEDELMILELKKRWMAIISAERNEETELSSDEISDEAGEEEVEN